MYLHKKLELIRNRYLRNKQINHHGDCCIYRSITETQYHSACTCGLIHDLIALNVELSEFLYSNLSEDYAKSDNVPYFEMKYKPILNEETKEAVINVFGQEFYLKRLNEIIENDYSI